MATGEEGIVINRVGGTHSDSVRWGVEWSGVDWRGVERSGEEWRGVERSGEWSPSLVSRLRIQHRLLPVENYVMWHFLLNEICAVLGSYAA